MSFFLAYYFKNINASHAEVINKERKPCWISSWTKEADTFLVAITSRCSGKWARTQRMDPGDGGNWA